MLRFENKIVSIALPDGWQDNSDDDTLSYANPDIGEELSLSFGSLAEDVGPSQLPTIVRRLIEHRAVALGKASDGKFSLTDTTQSRGKIPCVATISGIDHTNSIYALTSITCYTTHFVSISYYRHRCSVATPEIISAANISIGTCHVKGTA